MHNDEEAHHTTDVGLVWQPAVQQGHGVCVGPPVGGRQGNISAASSLGRKVAVHAFDS